jgi:outer membrane biosynthesis protein TonB
MNRKQLSKKLGKRKANYSDWRKSGKIIFFVHPKSEIGERTKIQFRKVVEGDDGELSIRTVYRNYDGDEDITYRFQAYLDGNNEIQLSDVVLRVQAGENLEEYTKGEILGLKEDGKGKKEPDWRKRLFRPRNEYLFSVVNLASHPNGTEVLPLPVSAAKKLMAIIDSQIEEYGEQDGDPWISPYALKVSFNPRESGANMYMVERHMAALTEPVLAIFNTEEPDDVEAICNNGEHEDQETKESLLASMCCIPCPLFDVEETEPQSVSPAPQEPAKSKAKPKPSVKPPESPSEPVVAPLPKPVKSRLDPSECVSGSFYIHHGEELKFVQWDKKKKRGVFLDEDGCKVAVPEGDLVEPRKEPPAEEASRAEDCIKGKSYYSANGALIKFVRFDAKKGQCVFTDSEGERVLLSPDEFVSEDVGDEPGLVEDALQPLVEAEDSEKHEPTNYEAPDDEADDSGVLMCPSCEQVVPQDATVCPHCETEFADDDEVPF